MARLDSAVIVVATRTRGRGAYKIGDRKPKAISLESWLLHCEASAEKDLGVLKP
jgi:hypothetical protein